MLKGTVGTVDVPEPLERGPSREEPDPAVLEAIAKQFPHLTAMMADAIHNTPENTLGWCDDQAEFEFGLDLLLDGLDRLRAGGTATAAR